MTDKNQCLIVYESGCYGTFVEWMLNFLVDRTIDLPFNNCGNSHKFQGNFLYPAPRLLEHVQSNKKQRFSRTHPCVFRADNNNLDQEFDQELKFYKEHFENILVLNYDHDTVLWYENNNLDKIFIDDITYSKMAELYGITKEKIKPVMTRDSVLRIKHWLNRELQDNTSSFKSENLLGWHKHSIYDFDVWQLRELLSFYWFHRNDGVISSWQKTQQNNRDIPFLSISEFKQDFSLTIQKIAGHFDLAEIDQETLQQVHDVHQQWLKLQKQIDKDSLCKKIVNSLISREFFNWVDLTPLSIIDEAWIQKSLRDQGVLIKCDGLDLFPTNTRDFYSLLEFTQEQQ
jgi:hypothetical protein